MLRFWFYIMTGIINWQNFSLRPKQSVLNFANATADGWFFIIGFLQTGRRSAAWICMGLALWSRNLHL
jgi:hypothetical protein